VKALPQRLSMLTPLRCSLSLRWLNHSFTDFKHFIGDTKIVVIESNK